MKKTNLQSQHGQTDFDQVYYQRFFKAYSNDELRIYHNWFDGWYRFLSNYLDLANGRGRQVLELGCSIGAFARLLKDHGFEVVASDVSDFIVKKAARLNSDIKFTVIDVEKNIKLKGRYDYIFAFEMVEHLQDPLAALNRIKTLLKRDGKLIISTPFPTPLSLSDPTHINVHDEKWWLAVGRRVGYRNGRLVHASFIPYLYRYSRFFSWGLPLKLNLPLINSTCFFIFDNS